MCERGVGGWVDGLGGDLLGNWVGVCERGVELGCCICWSVLFYFYFPFFLPLCYIQICESTVSVKFLYPCFCRT